MLLNIEKTTDSVRVLSLLAKEKKHLLRVQIFLNLLIFLLKKEAQLAQQGQELLFDFVSKIYEHL
jgi:hypothetical protein